MKIRYALYWLWAKLTRRNLLIIQKNKNGVPRLLEPEYRFELTHNRMRYIAGMYYYSPTTAWQQIEREAYARFLLGIPKSIQERIFWVGEFEFFWTTDPSVVIGDWIRFAWNKMWAKLKEIDPDKYEIKMNLHIKENI